METQSAIMDMDVFQTRLGVMLQWVMLKLSHYLIYRNTDQCVWIVHFGINCDNYVLLSVFRDMFGEECVDFSHDKNICVTVDGKMIHICLETRVRSTAEQHVWWQLLFFCFLIHSFWPPPQSVCVLWGWEHRGWLTERNGGSGSAAALWCPQPSHLRGETGLKDGRWMRDLTLRS